MDELAESYMKEIMRLWKRPEPGYGGNVLPAMQFYKSLDGPAERRAFQQALEKLLSHADEAVRREAVNQCLGFFVFRDAI